MSAVLPAIEQEISIWAVAIQQNLTNTYVCVSTFSFLLYDILINLDREIEYIWKARWSIPKALFIFARYYSPVLIVAIFAVTTRVGLPLQFCRGWMWYFPLAGNVPVATVVNTILTMRLYAMYQHRKALVFFILLNICGFTLEIYASTKISTKESVIPVPTGIPMPGCIAEIPDLSLSLIAYVTMLLISTTFFALTIERVVADRYRTPTYLMDIKYLSPLIVLIVRDGALFYFLLFVVLLVSIVILKVSQSLAVRTSSMVMLWRLGIYSWSASRLVLNLREAASRRTNMDTTTMGVQTMTAVAVTLDPMSMQNMGVESVA